MKTKRPISIKSPEELQILKAAGRILAAIIQELKCSLKSGVTTLAIDTKAESLIASHKVLPAFKGYRGYPNCICISVNEEIVHGIPSPLLLKDGDIVSLDVGIIHKNYYSDMAVTIPIGNISPPIQKLLDVARNSLYKGIEQARSGNQLSDISHAIQSYVEGNQFSIVREFVGHGIGKNLHEDPEIPNFGVPHQGPELKEGMVLAIEPMVNMGTWKTRVLADGWTVITLDGKPSAHFEHTIAITKGSAEILTQ